MRWEGPPSFENWYFLAEEVPVLMTIPPVLMALPCIAHARLVLGAPSAPCTPSPEPMP